jgi:hypothetical protein
MVSVGGRRAGALCAARLLSAASPVAVGVFGWLTAHLLTFWLLAHSHSASLSPAARHLHHYTASATVLVGCLAAASLLTALVTAPPRDPCQQEPAGQDRAVRRSIWMSSLAFVGAEVLEHAVLGGERKPPVILLAGLLLHAIAGALTTLTWRHYRDAVHRMWSMTRPLTAPALGPQPRVFGPVPGSRRHLCGSCITGRAPPAAVFV